MTKERWALIIMGVILLIMANVMVWMSLPVKYDPLVEKELQYVKELLESTKKENEILTDKSAKENKKVDSLLIELKKSANANWHYRQTIKELRNRKPDNALLDSLLRARERQRTHK